MQEEERNTPEMSGENEAPKKRGRKPKTAENAEVSVKRRPGRPKKVKDESAEAETPAADVPAAPKRSLDEVLDTAVRENRAKGGRSAKIPRDDGPSWRDTPVPAESPAETERDEEVFVPEDSGDAFAYHSEEQQAPRAEEEEVPASFSTTDEDLNPEAYKGREMEETARDDDERIAQAREYENASDEEPAREDSRNQDNRNRWQRNDRGQSRFQSNRNQNQQNNQRQQGDSRNNQNRFQNNRNQNQQNNQRQQGDSRNNQNRFQQNNRGQNQQNNQRQQGDSRNNQNRFQQNNRSQQQNLQRQKKPRWMQGGSAEDETINPADLTEWNALRSQTGIEDYLAQMYFGKLPSAQAETFEAALPVVPAEAPKGENAGTPEPSSSAEPAPEETPRAETPEVAEAKAEEPEAPLPPKSVGDMNYWELMANANDSTVKKLGLQRGEVKTEEAAPSPAEQPAEKPVFAEPDSIEISGFGEIGSVSGFEDLYKLGIREIQQKFGELGIEFRNGVGKSELMLDYYKHAVKGKKLVKVSGVLDVFEDGFGGAVAFDVDSYRLKRMSVYVPQFFIDKYALQRGHTVGVLAVPPRDGGKENCPVAVAVTSVMDGAPEEARNIVPFTDLTPYYPTRRIIMEADANSGWDNLSMRVVDLLTPVGFGQRALIVAPPRTGKTVLMQGMAKSIRRNAPKAHLIILLVDERPEEVTDFKRSVDAEVVSSTFDEDASNHVHAAEMVISRARRQVEAGRDVIILLDSITRLARAYNALMPNGGRTMSGGVEANALQKPKKFFGSARNIEGGGSLTIIGTALVETGSRMDEVIFEEFKGTGNLELHLDRSLSDKRIFPSINIEKSGTRKEELLYHPDEMSKIYALRRAMKGVPANDAMEMLVQRLKKVKTNIEFLLGLNR